MKIWREHLRLKSPDGWRESDWRKDLALVLMVIAIEIIGSYLVGQHQPKFRVLDSFALILLVTGAASLFFRRKYPVGVLLFANGTTLIYIILDYPKGPNFLAMIIAFFTVIMQGHRFITWAVLAGQFILFPWLPYLLGSEDAPSPSGIFGLAGWLLVLATIAEIAHIRQQRILRAREEEVRHRASEERLRIARELHDVLGHNISLISVQAGVALHLMEQQPEQARIALSVIRDASKEALRELRSVLDVLRQVNEEAPRSPSPSLANLSELIARASEAGLQVHTELSGNLKELPASVDLAAFRIVQEALTNVMRHSGQTSSTVLVTCNAEELTLSIENKVNSEFSHEGIRLGQGILGMRERAAALGGLVEAGLRADGGFRVFARLPLNGKSLPSQGALK
jgi:signal transduction histidine kinase